MDVGLGGEGQYHPELRFISKGALLPRSPRSMLNTPETLRFLNIPVGDVLSAMSCIVEDRVLGFKFRSSGFKCMCAHTPRHFRRNSRWRVPFFKRNIV